MENETLLSREDAVLVVIDMQEKLLPAIHEGGAVLDATRRLAEGMRALNVPILVTEQYPKGLGPTVSTLVEALGEARRWPKSSFSATQHAPFMDALEGLGRDQVVLCGVEAHICVLQTALELAAHGMQVHVAADAVSSRKASHRDNALERMHREGVIVSNVESALFECLGTAGTDVFKTISAIIR